MMRSVLVRSCPSSLVVESRRDLYRSRSSTSGTAVSSGSVSRRVSCSSRNYDIPKREPFSLTRFERILKDPPLIQKFENELTDYCTTLEGDECLSCWTAYSELKELEKECPKELERLINDGRGSGLKALISWLHSKAQFYRNCPRELADVKPPAAETRKRAGEEVPDWIIPDGLPKSQEELEEEEKLRMPDSQFTRLLKVMGRRSA